jgi:group I intron endonuclease
MGKQLGFDFEAKEQAADAEFEMPRAGFTYSGIYAIINIHNGKQYVGSAVDLWKRWRLHRNQLDAGIHHSRILQRAWNKYGSKSFSFRVIEKVENKECLLEREQYWLDTLRTADPSNGYNISPTAHSTLGVKRSKEFIRNMVLKRNGRRRSEEMKKRVKETGCYKIVSQKLTGRIISEETRKKLREANIGKIVSVEVRTKISKAHIGSKRSEESRQRMREAQRKRAQETAKISAVNTRLGGLRGTKKSVWITAFGETKTLPAWLIDPRCQATEAALRQRLYGGWDPEKAITEPTDIRFSRHRKCSITITAFGETKRLPDWLVDNRCVVKEDLLRYRIKSGWHPEIAITKPAGPRRKRT